MKESRTIDYTVCENLEIKLEPWKNIKIKMGKKHIIKFGVVKLEFKCINNMNYFSLYWNGCSIATLTIPVEKGEADE